MRIFSGHATSQHEIVGQEVYVSLDRQPWHDFMAPEWSHWASRSWTMQEEFLASRILSYNSLQISWDCKTASEVEAEWTSRETEDARIFRQLKSIQKKASPGPRLEIPTQLTGTYDEIPEDHEYGNDNYPYSFWYSIVRMYSKRNLSYVQDRLPAIGGMARCVQAQLEDTYCAGLWRNDLLRGLLWHSHDDDDKISSEYIGPSWTWVAIESNLIRWEKPVRGVDRELATIIDVHLEYESSNDPYGRVKAGRLIIRAPYLHLANIREDQHNSTPPTHFQQFINKVFEEDEGSSRCFRELRQQHRSCPGQHFAVLQIFKGTHEPFLELLILESADDHPFLNSDGENEVPYRRIGHVSLSRMDRSGAFGDTYFVHPGVVAAWDEVADQEEWPMKTITII